MRKPARRIGVGALLLAGVFVTLLLVYPRGGDDVSEECRAARDRANAWIKLPNPARIEEMRRICGSADRE